MNEHHPPAEALIAEAAARRAVGQSWETIGEAVDRHPDTVRRWPDRYWVEWNKTFRRVRTQAVQDAATEARTYLRALLRDKRARVCMGAATQLLRSGDRAIEKETEPAIDDATQRDAEAFRHLRSISDDDIAGKLERARIRDGVQECVDGAGV